MTPPFGYVYAIFDGSGAVKVPDVYPATAVDFVIPGAVLGPGDVHIVSEGEAWESSNWLPCREDGTVIEGKPLHLMTDEERSVALGEVIPDQDPDADSQGDDD